MSIVVRHGRRVRAFRHLIFRLVEALHVAVDIRGHAVPGLEDDDLLALHGEFIGDQRSGKAGADDYNIDVVIGHA